MSRYMVHYNGAAVFVKEREFFDSQVEQSEHLVNNYLE